MNFKIGKRDIYINHLSIQAYSLYYNLEYDKLIKITEETIILNQRLKINMIED